MTLAALVALGALAIAAFSLTRLSRMPAAPLPRAVERTFDSLRPGDIVLTPEGDWLVESTDRLTDAGVQAQVFALRSGRERCWLFVPPDGPVALASKTPETPHPDRVAGARRLDRSSIDLLPGG